jgi:serpin B
VYPRWPRSCTCPTSTSGGVQVVSLPYRGGLSMLVALPDDRRTLATVERELATRHRAWLGALEKDKEWADVQLPRWTATIEYGLVATLMSLGMRRAFERGADFSGIARAPLVISEVAHKAFVAVDEVGTEASAATATVIMVVSGTEIRGKPIAFHADHPFLYFLEDPSTGAVFFAGRVSDPR